MKRIVVLLLLVGGCTSTTNTTKEIAPKQSNWSVGCQPDQKDPYGKLIEKASCWAMLTDFKQSDLGLSHGVATIFKINANGPWVVMQPKLSPEICDHPRPRKKAVDGKRIDNLKMNQQIAAIRSGTIYVRETNRGWPYCNITNTVAHVSGADEAFLSMVSMWKLKVR